MGVGGALFLFAGFGVISELRASFLLLFFNGDLVGESSGCVASDIIVSCRGGIFSSWIIELMFSCGDSLDIDEVSARVGRISSHSSAIGRGVISELSSPSPIFSERLGAGGVG